MHRGDGEGCYHKNMSCGLSRFLRAVGGPRARTTNSVLVWDPAVYVCDDDTDCRREREIDRWDDGAVRCTRC
eukprot:3932938-Rhodomonas_salina.2